MRATLTIVDRSNIGNANLTGFSDDLGLVGNQYGAAVSVVYATYVVFEPFWNIMLKILTPKLLMTGSCLAWSALTIGTAFAKSFDQLVGIRVLLGAAEAAIIPCVLMYVTMTVRTLDPRATESFADPHIVQSGRVCRATDIHLHIFGGVWRFWGLVGLWIDTIGNSRLAWLAVDVR